MRDGGRVLVIDDCESDVLLLDLAFQEVVPGVTLQSMLDGEEVQAFLDNLRQDHERTPALILLDLNLPRLTGFELLTLLRSEPRLASIPIVVHSTSNAPRDRERCTHLGASAYYTKSDTYDNLLKLIRSLTSEFGSGTAR